MKQECFSTDDNKNKKNNQLHIH